VGKICGHKRTDFDIVGTLLCIPKRFWQHLLPCVVSWLCTCLGSGSEELVFVRFVKSRTCYDVMPYSCKLVVFDTQLKVSRVVGLIAWSLCINVNVIDFAVRKLFRGE